EHELSNNMISFLSVSIIDIVEEAKDESDTPKGKLFCFYIYKGKDITKCTSKLEQLRDGIVKGKLPLNNLKTMAKVQVSKSNEAIDSNTNNKQYLLSVLRGVTREEYEAMEPLLTDSHSVVIGQDPDTFDIYMTEQSEEQISEVMKTAFVITTGNTYDKFKAFSMNKEARIKASIVRALDKRSSTILYNKTNPREFINVNANGIKYYITCEHNGQIVNVEIPELSASRSEMGEKEFEQATFDIASSFDEIGILDANKENTEHTLPEIQQKGINYQPISENIIKVQKYKTQLLKR
ncbi:MAG: hypothetical protein Q4E54_03485, partial [Lachnospiraceae bacterium]|nr:hypothetical protein [Lachnospiraceae bacterium]